MESILLPRFDFDNPPVDPINLAYELAEVLVTRNAIGLAAPQINLPYRVLSLKSNPIMTCFNPILVHVSEATSTMEEGSLSLPGFVVKIKRPETIKVRFTEPNRNVRTEIFTGLTARYFQQGLDYLDGIPFTKRANPVHKQQAEAKKKKHDRNG